MVSMCWCEHRTRGTLEGMNRFDHNGVCVCMYVLCIYVCMCVYYVCMHACIMYEWMYMYMCVCIMYVCMYVLMTECMYVSVYIHTCICLYLRVCLYIYIYIYICTFMCMCIYSCVYIYIHNMYTYIYTCVYICIYVHASTYHPLSYGLLQTAKDCISLLHVILLSQYVALIFWFLQWRRRVFSVRYLSHLLSEYLLHEIWTFSCRMLLCARDADNYPVK